MNLLLRCEDVTHLATDHFEGRLPLGLALRMRLHLALCRACRAFLRSLRTLPRFLGVLAAGTEAAPALETPACRQQKAALAGALARLGATPRPLPPPAHPLPDAARAAAPGPGIDRCLAFMVRAYEHLHAAGPVAAEPHLPPDLLAELPTTSTWDWSRALLNGCRIAELLQDPATGARLYLLVLPPGRRFPDHVHRGGEDFLVLHGHAEDETHYLGPGDWLRRGEGTDHRDVEGRREACWGLVRTEREGIRLLGWRGLLQGLFGRRAA